MQTGIQRELLLLPLWTCNPIYNLVASYENQGYVPRSHTESLCSTVLIPGKYFRLSFTKDHESLMEGVSYMPSIINNINILNTIYLLPSKINHLRIVGKSYSIKKKNKSHRIIYSKVLTKEYIISDLRPHTILGVFSDIFFNFFSHQAAGWSTIMLSVSGDFQ